MPVPDLHAPILDQSHLDNINTGLAYVEVGKHRIKLAKQAGLDMTQEESDLTRHEKTLRAIKQTYFPNKT